MAKGEAGAGGSAHFAGPAQEQASGGVRFDGMLREAGDWRGFARGGGRGVDETARTPAGGGQDATPRARRLEGAARDETRRQAHALAVYQPAAWSAGH